MKRKRKIRVTTMFLSAFLLLAAAVAAGVLAMPGSSLAKQSDNAIILRVCNWEEYMDLGDWSEEERIELDNGVEIFGQKALYEDFEDWYLETYGKAVHVEYSCFGTNEDLYNQLTLGDVYDLVCPSEYMIMKLMADEALVPYSSRFYDEDILCNYYISGVSPFIYDTLSNNTINGESWSKYAAGYMWGVTGILYNPELVTDEEASTWEIFDNPAFYRQITLKDNVRDSYFAALGILKSDRLLAADFVNAPDYHEKLAREMNDVSPQAVADAEAVLKELRKNIYSLETDSGKSDMVSGKIVANYQWSGDAVYAMDLAEEDDVFLEFAVPKECTNLWFDGWVMLKAGIDGDAEKQHAAEAFVNFVSRPDNAVRNMYYIGYTSAIAGGDDDTVFSYLDWCHGAEEGVEYPVGYFFSGDNGDEDYILIADEEQMNRQLFAQYPPEDVIARSAVMEYFDQEESKAINQMWINVRCFNIGDVPGIVWILLGALLLAAAGYAAAKKIRGRTDYDI